MSHKVTLDSKTRFARVGHMHSDRLEIYLANVFTRTHRAQQKANHVLISHEFVVQNYLLLYHRYYRDPSVNTQGNIIWILPQQRYKIDRSFLLHVLLDISIILNCRVTPIDNDFFIAIKYLQTIK
jgi:hypothetical protein